jgi:hypothetical protein
MQKIKANDKQFAITSFGVRAGKEFKFTDFKAVQQFLEQHASKAKVTNSNLLVDRVLIAYVEGAATQTWKNFVKSVLEVAVRHAAPETAAEAPAATPAAAFVSRTQQPSLEWVEANNSIRHNASLDVDRANMQLLQAGDEVVINAYSHARFAKVARVTATQIILENGQRFRRDNGYEMGDKWRKDQLSTLVVAQREREAIAKRRRDAENAFTELTKSARAYNVETLEQVVAMLEAAKAAEAAKHAAECAAQIASCNACQSAIVNEQRKTCHMHDYLEKYV